jgi:hypothetical protein
VPLFLKVIKGTSYIDTNASSIHLEMNLMNLDTYMKTVNGNIEKFNQYVTQMLLASISR